MANADLLVSASSTIDCDKLVADWKWAYERLAAGDLDSYCGKFVAVLKSEVVGGGSDQEELRASIAQQRNVDGERVVILFVDDGAFLILG